MTPSKRVLIIGSGPLPNDLEGIREAAGLRTEQFVSAVQTAGHEVSLFCIHNNQPYIKEETKNSMPIWRICRTDNTLLRQLRQFMSKVDPEVIIGVNTFPSYVASQVCGEIPFWADLNGWIMAEAQARSWSEKSNVHFANAWRQEKTILERANGISTVSDAQKFCVIGEFASIGQLRQENFLESRVFSIPNSTKWFDIDKTKEETSVEVDEEKGRGDFDKSETHVEAGVEATSSTQRKENMFINQGETTQRQHVEVLSKNPANKEKNRDTDNFDNSEKEDKVQNMFRGKTVPNDAFVVAWIGGYNNWVDEQALFEGIEKAMSTMSNLYFVSTGGAIPKVANDTFGRFRQRIDMSKFKNRFIFLGWIASEDMKKIYAESDVGINIDFKCIETESGARNRINEMMKFGLPVVSTNGSEIGKAVGEYGAGISIGYKNTSEDLANAIDTMAKMSKEERKKMGKNGQKVIFEIFAEAVVMKPVVKFIENPNISKYPSLAQEGIRMLAQNAWWYAKKNGWKTLWNKIVQRVL